MKKIVALLFIVAFFAAIPASVFAEGFTLSGEAKTGLYWEKIEEPDQEPKVKANIHSQDDAGNYEGRFRLNMDYLNEAQTLGFKVRIQWQTWTNETQTPDLWPYAFGYGNFFNNQLTVAIGKLGGSPWSTGGPEMWKELEMGRSGGVRFEWKPAFIPEEYGKINLGFVLNGPESYTDAGMSREPEIGDYLKESVIGLSYTHDYFMLRMAYRLDSELDIRNRGTSGKEGDSFIYRVEEHAIEKLLPDFRIWALGYIEGVGAENETFLEHKNWVFVQYAPPNFTAQIRLGYEGSTGRSLFFVKPYFMYRFFDGLFDNFNIEAGGLFGIAQDFGNKIYVGSPYSYMELVPKIQINFAQGAYTAFEYYYKMEYAYKTDPPFKQTQWMNLRFGIYF